MIGEWSAVSNDRPTSWRHSGGRIDPSSEVKWNFSFSNIVLAERNSPSRGLCTICHAKKYCLLYNPCTRYRVGLPRGSLPSDPPKTRVPLPERLQHHAEMRPLGSESCMCVRGTTRIDITSNRYPAEAGPDLYSMASSGRLTRAGWQLRF